MIPISGLPSITGLNIVDATRDSQLNLIRNTAQHERAIEHFLTNIKDVESVDQLMEDQQLYSFVMRAFDLEDQIFGKAMIKQVLESNIEESDALVNRLTDPRFREMYQELGFGTNGEGNLNTILTNWQNRMVDRYVERQFINFQDEQNPTVGIALDFRSKASGIDTAFDILNDSNMTSFFQTALGLPTSMSGLDIDKQAALIKSKIDLETLNDPEVVEKMIRKYVAISDALSGSAATNNAAVQLLTGSASNAAASIFEITSSFDRVGYSASSLYS